MKRTQKKMLTTAKKIEADAMHELQRGLTAASAEHIANAAHAKEWLDAKELVKAVEAYAKLCLAASNGLSSAWAVERAREDLLYEYLRWKRRFRRSDPNDIEDR